MKSNKFCFMDCDAEENEIFFSTLYLFIRNSTMIGCVNTSLAASKLLLSLDPLRDPKGILTVMDYFALATLREEDYRFLIELVDSNMVRLIIFISGGRIFLIMFYFFISKFASLCV